MNLNKERYLLVSKESGLVTDGLARSKFEGSISQSGKRYLRHWFREVGTNIYTPSSISYDYNSSIIISRNVHLSMQPMDIFLI